MRKVQMNLLETDGNSFSLLGIFAAKAREQGWNAEEIKAVRDEALSDDYNHLLNTLCEHTEPDAD